MWTHLIVLPRWIQ